MSGLEGLLDLRVLHRQGQSIRAIALELGISRSTVRKHLRADQVPAFSPCRTRPSKLDPFRVQLQGRVAAAHPEWIPAPVLLGEIKALGITGGSTITEQYLGSE